MDWGATSDLSGFSAGVNALTVKFSPNLASDQVLTAVICTASNTYFEMFSMNQKKWNSAASFSNYPVTVTGAAAPQYGQDQPTQICY